MVTGVSQILAVIPARGGSQSVPRKNVCQIAGHTLLAWSVAAAQQARLVKRIVVSTDDDEIAAFARPFGAEVPFTRPAQLAQNDTRDFPFHKCVSLRNIGVEPAHDRDATKGILISCWLLRPRSRSPDERHITVDRAMRGSDQAASVEPVGPERLVKYIRVVEQALGDGMKRVYDSELPIKNRLRRPATLTAVSNG